MVSSGKKYTKIHCKLLRRIPHFCAKINFVGAHMQPMHNSVKTILFNFFEFVFKFSKKIRLCAILRIFNCFPVHNCAQLAEAGIVCNFKQWKQDSSKVFIKFSLFNQSYLYSLLHSPQNKLFNHENIYCLDQKL